MSDKMTDYHADAAFAEKFLNILHGRRIEAVVSYDYFPLISMLCELNQIPYMAWIYDCPQYTLYSKTITSEWNYLFCFDRVLAMSLEQRGAKKVYPFPLGTDVEGFAGILNKGKIPSGQYGTEIAFVGSLYEKASEKLKSCDLSEYQKGYLEGIIMAQEKIYGYNFVKETLPRELVQDIVNKGELKLGAFYDHDDGQMAADAVNLEISGRERRHVLERLAQKWEVVLYSGSPRPEEWKQTNIRSGGYASYESHMPAVFHQSRINLNITSKTIVSGIPQRVLDIMACGGFCLTNYQPEIEEWFREGEEIVQYGSMEELMDKAGYYLEHEEERKKIAENGFEKVNKVFRLENRWELMKKLVKES